jgi:2-oxoglutarate ferredoxin oxidoreductase subunit beta
MPVRTKPSVIVKQSGYCGGCGHGIVQRLIAECVEELGLADRTINVVDIACCFWSLDALNFDGIAGPHGRCAAVATAIKKVRPSANVFVHAGDGASYGIGLLETIYAALRDVPITMIVVNNGIFGMTGGQMCPSTTMIGQSTTSSRKGRDRELHGIPADFLKEIANHDIQFAARGALYNVKEIRKTKSYIKKGFTYQQDNKGFSLIDVLSPCPTNWGLSAIEAEEKIEHEIAQFFKPGVYKDRGSGE